MYGMFNRSCDPLLSSFESFLINMKKWPKQIRINLKKKSSIFLVLNLVFPLSDSLIKEEITYLVSSRC